MLTFDLFTARSNLLPHAFVWAIYIYIRSIEVTCRSTVAKIVLIGNLRWPPFCLCLLNFPATVLFTCIKSWFFRNHLANFHQISHWSYCWNVIGTLFKRSRSIDCQAHIFFFKTKNCSNDDLFISCDDRIGKMLYNICMSAVAISLRWASRGPWASCLQLLSVKVGVINSFTATGDNNSFCKQHRSRWDGSVSRLIWIYAFWYSVFQLYI